MKQRHVGEGVGQARGEESWSEGKGRPKGARARQNGQAESRAGPGATCSVRKVVRVERQK